TQLVHGEHAHTGEIDRGLALQPAENRIHPPRGAARRRRHDQVRLAGHALAYQRSRPGGEAFGIREHHDANGAHGPAAGDRRPGAPTVEAGNANVSSTAPSTPMATRRDTSRRRSTAASSSAVTRVAGC